MITGWSVEASEDGETFDHVANLAVCDKCQKPLVIGEWPFCPHGFGSQSVVGDDIPGGFVQRNFGHEPEVFYSKRAMAQRAKELGLTPMVRHVEGDKHVSRWV